MIFFLKALQQQKHKLEVKVAKERLMQEKLPELSLQILELIKEHGRINLNEAVAVTHANRNTIKKHIQQLVGNNYIMM